MVSFIDPSWDLFSPIHGPFYSYPTAFKTSLEAYQAYLAALLIVILASSRHKPVKVSFHEGQLPYLPVPLVHIFVPVSMYILP
jgi:hypothetical protein